MKKPIVSLALVLGCLLGIHLMRSKGADNQTFQNFEYVTIRWGGRENTHVIRANGRVEFLATVLGKVPRPDRSDDRAFYMKRRLQFGKCFQRSIGARQFIRVEDA